MSRIKVQPCSPVQLHSVYRRARILFAVAVFSSGPLWGSGFLAYFEAQGIVGRSSLHQTVFYSMNPDETMQKPSLGLDGLGRISGASGDAAVLALQVRLAYDETEKNGIQPQLYNAYAKWKWRFSDVWIGHNRPAVGMSSYLDSHALLLPTLAMRGFGFDRDWGIGFYRPFEKGDLALSVTTGSGMPLLARGNFFAAGRVSRGVLVQDNWNIGFTLSYGDVLHTMGYRLAMPEPFRLEMIGTDFTRFWNAVEVRAEGFLGRRDGRRFSTLFLRIGLNLFEENRLKIEMQPAAVWDAAVFRRSIAAGISWLVSGDWTMRSMFEYGRPSGEKKAVVQFYYYKRL